MDGLERIALEDLFRELHSEVWDDHERTERYCGMSANIYDLRDMLAKYGYTRK